MKKKIDFEPPPDLLEIRRQLIAMRSLYSHDRRVTAPINNLIRKPAHLHEPKIENMKHVF
jgi:hypothetical protein